VSEEVHLDEPQLLYA